MTINECNGYVVMLSACSTSRVPSAEGMIDTRTTVGMAGVADRRHATFGSSSCWLLVARVRANEPFTLAWVDVPTLELSVLSRTAGCA